MGTWIFYFTSVAVCITMLQRINFPPMLAALTLAGVQRASDSNLSTVLKSHANIARGNSMLSEIHIGFRYNRRKQTRPTQNLDRFIQYSAASGVTSLLLSTTKRQVFYDH